jgi:hypothetical protein
MRTSLFWDVTQRWPVVVDVSRQPVGLLFSGQAVREEFIAAMEK